MKPVLIIVAIGLISFIFQEVLQQIPMIYVWGGIAALVIYQIHRHTEQQIERLDRRIDALREQLGPGVDEIFHRW